MHARCRPADLLTGAVCACWHANRAHANGDGAAAMASSDSADSPAEEEDLLLGSMDIDEAGGAVPWGGQNRLRGARGGPEDPDMSEVAEIMLNLRVLALGGAGARHRRKSLDRTVQPIQRSSLRRGLRAGSLG